MATPQESENPESLSFDSIIVDVCFHPQKDIIACASIDGDVTVHSYSVQDDNKELSKFDHHKKACRALRFLPDGNSLCTVSKDKSLQVVDLNRGHLTKCIKKAHENPIYSLLIADQNIVATGDDEGCLKVWDLRSQKAVMDLKECENFISDMILDNNQRVLLAASGEGTLSAFDIRKHKMKMQSELFDAEFLSLVPMKRQTKLVCGSGDGVLNIFNWGEWGNISDRFPGHPMSIDCIVPITEEIICTGSIDGIIRAVNIYPNALIGAIGEHDDFPIENLSKSHCGKFLASCSHDQKVKFWNIEDLPNVKVEPDKKKAAKAKQTAALTKDDFFADMIDGKDGDDAESESSDEDDSFDSSDDDSEANNGNEASNQQGANNCDNGGDTDTDSENSHSSSENNG